MKFKPYFPHLRAVLGVCVLGLFSSPKHNFKSFLNNTFKIYNILTLHSVVMALHYIIDLAFIDDKVMILLICSVLLNT